MFADVLCSCPQKCDTRVAKETRAKLLAHFGQLGDHAAQNAYLQSYIEMRSVYRRLWAEEEKVRGRLPRRVSCKYRVPTADMPPVNPNDLPKPRLITSKSHFPVGVPYEYIFSNQARRDVAFCRGGELRTKTYASAPLGQIAFITKLGMGHNE